MADISNPCSVGSMSSDTIAEKRMANLSKVYNFIEPKPVIEQQTQPTVEDPQPVKVKRTGLKELDQLIISILESTKGGPSSPAFVHAIIKNKGYGYTGKQVCNKMWALERKGLIRKEQSGAYSAIQQEAAIESDTQE